MKMIRPLLLGSFLMLNNTVAWSWYIDMDASNQVIINNTSQISGQNDIYLFWYNPDMPNPAQQSGAWTQQMGWQTLSADPLPITPQPFDFIQLQTTALPYDCDPQHRCFLVFAAVDPRHNPLVTEHWQQAAILPLNATANHAYLSGQMTFGSERPYQGGTEGSATAAIEFADATLSSVSELKNTWNTNRPTEVEKPDIFKRVGNQILYANTAAQTFQVIDVSNTAKPRIVGELALQGIPQEIYAMNGYYVLLQQVSTRHTRQTIVTVLQLGATEPMRIVSEVKLAGYFKESRRRNTFIYTVTDSTPLSPFTAVQCTMPSDCETWRGMTVTALQLNAAGQLTVADYQQFGGWEYATRVAIFADYLVIASRSVQQLNRTDIQVFELATLNRPLVRLPLLTVPGYVPSEFHLHIHDNRLHIMHYINWYSGSTLSIYKLAPTTPQLQGQLYNVALGEALTAMRFSENKAYVTTAANQMQRLSVIDISNPSRLAVLGELKDFGETKQLFVNDEQLLAVGFDYMSDANLQSESPTRLAEMRLLDVRNPMRPILLDSIIPLAGQTNWTSYNASALSLDWQYRYAVLPIYAWDVGDGMHLPIVTFANNRFLDAGRVESPVYLGRSLPLSDTVFAALGYQSLITVKWGEDKPKLLAELELGVNLWWLNAKNGALWAGGRGNKGFYRFYEYDPTNPAKPVESWQMASFFDNIAMDKQTAVFYQDTPLSVQALDLESRELTPVMYLEGWYSPPHNGRSRPLVHDSWFYLGEQRTLPTEVQSSTFTDSAENTAVQATWVLRSWDLKANGQVHVEYSVPGRPIGFTSQGYLITRDNPDGMTRLNLLRLTYGQTDVLDTQSYPCRDMTTRVIWSDAVYIHCDPYDYAQTEALPTGFSQQSLPFTLKLAVENHFIKKGHWLWNDSRNVIQAQANKVVVEALSSSQCEIYQLVAGGKTKRLTELERCPWGDVFVMGNQRAWWAKRYSGIEVVNW